VCVCTCMLTHACVIACTCRSEDNLQELILSFRHVWIPRIKFRSLGLCGNTFLVVVVVDSSRLASNSQRSACLCILGAGTKGVSHHCPKALQFFFFFFLIIYFMHEYSVAVFRHTRRGHQISLQMVVSHHVVAGI